MRKLFKERKLFKGGNYMRKYGMWFHVSKGLSLEKLKNCDLLMASPSAVNIIL